MTRATGNREPGFEPASGELRKGADIAERLLNFATAVAVIVRSLPRDTAGRHISGQLFRASTAGGSNYEEARGAESAADFVHKLHVGIKELRESVYWLKLIKRADMSKLDLAPTVREGNELIAILVTSAKTAKARDENK